METKLNQKTADFFKKYSLEDITIENIKNHFENIKDENSYGNLLHAAVNYLFPEDKVLKLIEILLNNGVDANLKGKNTGYSFIHLALYGYTENDEDYSYSTEFIVKLITIAKQYNFDVQIADDDLDSIAHTALASEVYTGSVVEIIEALGNRFDTSCKDIDGDDLYHALLKYKNEAKEIGNNVWYERLVAEEDKIMKMVSKYRLEEINNQISLLVQQLDDSMENINIEYLLNHYSEILETKKQLESYLSKKHLFSEKKTEDTSLWSKYDSLLKKILLTYINNLSTNPNYKAINELLPILESFEYQEEIEIINSIKLKYSNHIESIEKSIVECQTLNELEKWKSPLHSLGDKEVVNNLLAKYEKQYNLFENLITQIEELTALIKITGQFLSTNLIKITGQFLSTNLIKIDNLENRPDYNNMTLKELKQISSECIKQLEDSKNQIQQEIRNQFNSLLQTVFSLEDFNIFSNEKLWEILNSTIEDFRIVSKQKKKECKYNG